jgi:transcriptional regulator with XRE-family HTH domain
MKFNVEKLKQISRPLTQRELEEVAYREENQAWLDLSAKFALSVRQILRMEQISQTELASRMGVSCAQITKLLSGKENIGLQTIAKVEKALGKRVVKFSIDDEDDAPVQTQYVFTQVLCMPSPGRTSNIAVRASDMLPFSTLFTDKILV